MNKVALITGSSRGIGSAIAREFAEESYDIAYPWIHTSINFENIKKLTDNIKCIFSDDDYFVSLD